jgi:serine/threonine protein kinase
MAFAMNVPAPAENPLRGSGRSVDAIASYATFAASEPPRIPDHELLRCIGRGSYGEVWLARNVVGTLRALKVVHRTSFENERPYEREYAGIQKFEPVSRTHEGFVDILQIGRNDVVGYFYYVMELADSVSSIQSSVISNRASETAQALANAPPLNTDLLITDYSPKTLRSEIARRTRLPFDDCVALALTLTHALHALHEKGLVHRDIKPSNIIFVGGVPKLADIGLVTDAGEARSYVGTEGFIPPEGPGTPAADLFGLGKVLYEASTGKDRQDFPEPLTNLGDQPDKDRLLGLNAILHRACQSDPRARYRSAEEMLAELELLQRGESVKRKRAVERRWRLVKKIAIAAAVGTLGAIGFVSIRPSRPQPLDPLTTGKNVGGYPPSAMRGTTNKAAWDHYRLGFAAQARWDKKQATAHYNAAIALDPKFTLAYAMLWWIKAGDTWQLTHGGSDEFRRLAAKLVELDNGLAETHAVLGFIRFWEWKWSEAEAE